jgi:hypothetical protein
MKFLATNSYRLAISMIIPLLVMASPGFSAAAAVATSVENIKQETAELLEALKAYSTEQRDAAIEQSRVALENLDQRIDALEIQMLDQWHEMDQATRTRTRDSLQALREQRTNVAEWYGSLKSSSADAWGSIKEGFSAAYQTLSEDWQKSEAVIGNDDRK